MTPRDFSSSLHRWLPWNRIGDAEHRSRNSYCLPSNYIERTSPSYFDDSTLAAIGTIHQPDVYVLAEYLLSVDHRTCVLDIGCGNGQKLAALQCHRKIGIDYQGNLIHWRSVLPDAQALEHDLENGLPNDIGNDPIQTVVICADVVEHLRDPRPMLKDLASLAEAGAVVVMSTPDRHRVQGVDRRGPPHNVAHVREWALDEWREFTTRVGLSSIFSGYTFNNNRDLAKKTIASIHDARIARAMASPSEVERPLAIVAIFNDIDIIEKTIRACLDEDCDLFLIDNWSTDGSYEAAQKGQRAESTRISLERFPPEGQSEEFLFFEILERKSQIASLFTGRWIIHWDSDEIRQSAWPHLSLRRTLGIVEAAGYNAVEFCVVDFRPTRDGFSRRDDPLSFFKHFEFGSRPGHFAQRKAWKQPDRQVNLAESGGHAVLFDGLCTFPYRMLLRHYPLRSRAQAQRKIHFQRIPRMRRERANRGWHVQYDGLMNAVDLLWSEESLLPYDNEHFPEEYLLELVSDVVARRQAQNWAALFPRPIHIGNLPK